MRTYALPKIGLVFGRVRHKILLVGFAEFRLPKKGRIAAGNFSGTCHAEISHPRFSRLGPRGQRGGLHLAKPRPALANPGGRGCPGTTPVQKHLALTPLGPRAGGRRRGLRVDRPTSSAGKPGVQRLGLLKPRQSEQRS